MEEIHLLKMKHYKNLNKNVEISNDLLMLESTIVSFCNYLFRISLFSSRYSNDPEEGIRELASLTRDPKIFLGVNPGDIYGILIEHLGRQQKFKQVDQ